MPGNELAKEIEQAAHEVFAGSGVFLAYAYGSRIAGSPLPDSDLDIGYYLSGCFSRPPLPIREEMLLADRLSSAIGQEVDLRDLARAPLEMRGVVLEEGIRVYCCDEVARVNLERDLLTRYHDCKEELERFHSLRLKQIARMGLGNG